jgi:predicted MFS family arabinose efflux permease
MPRPSRGANGWTRRQNVKTSEPTPAFIAPVLAAGVLMAMLMGTRSSMGLFIGPINTATALGAATVSFAFALSQLGWGAAQPLAGLLAGRFGTARVVIAGGVVSAIGLALITVAASGPALMANLLVAGAAGAAAGGAPLLMGAVAQRVSAEKRGLAMGLVSAGSSAGQLLLAPLAALLIAGIGWQVAMLVFAVLVVAVLPAALVFRRPPVAADGAGPGAAPIDARTALRQPSFWFITAGFFVCGFHISFLTTHMPGVLELCGFSPGFSGLWLAIVGGCNIVGSLVSGWLMQRVPMKSLLGTLYALRAAGVALFLLAPASREVLLGFALWMGITYMATLPPTSGIIAKLYGAKNVAVLFGVTMAMHQVGSFLGVWLGGLELELTGAYHWVWLLDILLATAAALAHLPIRERGPGAGALPRRPLLAGAAR